MELSNQEISFLIQQVLRTMGMEPDVDSDDESLIWVDDDWKIFLPNDEMECVVIKFDDLTNPHVAADIAMRFTNRKKKGQVNYF